MPMRGIRLEAAHHLDAVELRHHDVEEHEVGRGLPDAGQRLLAVAGDDDVVPVRRQPPREHVPVLSRVVDDEDERRVAHETAPFRQEIPAPSPAASVG
jgi:hypothetical protein